MIPIEKAIQSLSEGDAERHRAPLITPTNGLLYSGDNVDVNGSRIDVDPPRRQEEEPISYTRSQLKLGLDPWEPIIVAVEVSEAGQMGNFTVRINPYSRIISGSTWESKVAITNFTDPIVIEGGVKVWIEAKWGVTDGVVNDGSPTSVTLVYGETPWDTYPDMYFLDLGNEEFIWYQMLFYRWEIDGEGDKNLFENLTKYVIEGAGTIILGRATTTHLWQQRMCLDGILLNALVPFAGSVG